ncbi:MAG: DNA polymerase/3'-5' exonuclease PolX [Halanaerobiaceae bacterium]
MPNISNKDVASILNEMAELMELKGENKFKIRAYYNASRRIDELTDDIKAIADRDELESIDGIGSGIATAIYEILENGYSPVLEEIKADIPAGVVEMTGIPGLGPVRARQLYENLGINSLEDLRSALEKRQIRSLKGFGQKSEEKILKSLNDYENYMQVHVLFKAILKSEEIKNHLEHNDKITCLETAGSVRRRKELIGDIDIIAVSEYGEEVSGYFVSLPFVKEVIVQGSKKTSILTEGNFQVDLRIVSEEEFPAALQYFTGSREHNVRMREIAKKQGYKLNEYGLFEGENRIEISDETDIYEKLGLNYIIPELREDKGEIEAAKEGLLPDSVHYSDIKGDLHVHSRYTDGAYTIEEIVQEARRRDYEYIAITDHSQSLHIANGMKPETLFQQWEEIDELREKYDDIKILKGIEVDIDSEGNLDYSDEILKRLDIVIASIHSGFNQSEEQITKRIISAMNSPYVNVIGHLRGRIMKKRKGYPVNINKVLEAAAKTGTCLEINASPYRLDIDDIICRQAKEKNIKIAINTDAHHLNEFDDVILGTAVARRGWLEKSDIINAMETEKLMEFLTLKLIKK